MSDPGAMSVVTLLVNAAALAAGYALIASGFVLILAAADRVNFAQGDLCVAGGYLAIAVAALLPNGPGPVAALVLLLATSLGIGALGLLLHRVAIRPLASRPPVAAYVATIAIGLMIENVLLGTAGPEPRAGPPLAPDAAGTMAFLPPGVSLQSIAVIAVAGIVLSGLHLALAGSRTGRRFRAAAADPETASALGIPAGAMAAVAFACGAALAGIAGLLLAHGWFVAPGDGTALMLKAYIAVTLGGWGRLDGALLGAVLIATSETVLATLLSTPLAEAVLYVSVLPLLLLRPNGLLPEPPRARP